MAVELGPLRLPSETLPAHVHRLPRTGASDGFRDRLAERRARVGAELAGGRRRSRYFPVLAVLAPVMTQTEGEITYPGDPMCLYSALSVATHRAVRDSGPVADAEHYDGLAPGWTRFPDTAYRLAVDDDGYRPCPDDPNTDQTVFDPRVWDERSADRWQSLLREVRPRVVLISAVSPGHRYALEIARQAKERLPDTFVVLGGRHVDETVRLEAGDSVRGDPSSPLAVMRDGRAARVVDAVISGEAYHSLDLLMRALALSIDLDGGWVDRGAVRGCLEGFLARDGESPGRSLVVLVDGTELHAYPQDGAAISLESLPSPYEAFAIRSRFPIFTDPAAGNRIRRTGHIMVSNACPYHCNFCSESARLAHGLKRFRTVATGVARVCEYVGYGAEALFFDDSVFWSGSQQDIEAFCELLDLVRRGVAEPPGDGLLTGRDDRARLRDLEWGAQLTIDGVATLRDERAATRMLRLMAGAGCSYVYLGIESMSAQVMDGIHKNVRRRRGESWSDRARRATSLVKSGGLRVGTSILFGLDGETRESIDETIEAVGLLIDDRLVDLASPNILTYHPATPVTRMHGMSGRLDYHSPRLHNRKPYTYFEEAFPGVVSRALDEDDLWHIHRQTERRWGGARNDSPAPAARA